MSIPTGLGILSILLFNITDTFFISLLGTDALTAISFTFPLTFIISSIIIGFGSGLSAALARLIGKGETDNLKSFVISALLLGLVTIAVLTTLGFWGSDPLFRLLGAEEKLLPLIHDYLNVWLIAIVFLVVPMMGNSALRATGNAKYPSYIMMGAGIVNVVLDPILIFGFGPIAPMGIQGAAVATLIAWAMSLVASLIMLHRSELIGWVNLTISGVLKTWRTVLRVGQAAAISQMINPLFNAIVMSMLASIDSKAVAAYGVGIRIESVMLIGVIALASSLMPFLAQNMGAGQVERAKSALLGSAKFSIISQFVLYVIIALLARPLAGLFSDDEAVIDYVVVFLYLVPFAYGALGMVIVVANALNAYNRPGASLLVNVARLFLLMLPMVWLGKELLGTNGVFAAIAIGNILMGGACYILATRITEGKSS
ncbi:MATE family efflux transporter [Psychrobium sp. MM17-31]|nr:MATE family efflux transporter [Psychrobium sp. MM17-31]MCG7532481.1 MATE family efflux transporter [Psychrobium sp. MM17-31]